AAGAAHECDFTDRERREVVVEHEPLPRFAVDGFHFLLIVGGAKRCGHERLCFAARENCRPMYPWKNANFDRDRSDLVEPAAVQTLATLENFVAENFLFEFLEDRLGVD